jgi:hypothetical protein
MVVEAIRSNDNPKRISYIDSAIIGALGGYALKWVIPVTSQEKDTAYKTALLNIEKEAKKAAFAEIEKIRQTKPDGFDVFERVYNKQVYESGIEKLPKHLMDKVMPLIARVNEKAETTKVVGKHILTTFTKSIRPSKAFLEIGVGLTIGAALIHNILNEIAQDAQENNY